MQPCSNGDNFDARSIIFDLWFLLCAQVLSSDVHKTAIATVPIFLHRCKRTVLIMEAFFNNTAYHFFCNKPAINDLKRQ